MPSPPKSALLLSLAATAAIVVFGAWSASRMTGDPVPPATERPSPTTLSVIVSGTRSTSGTVYAIVFDSENAYDTYDYRNAAGVAALPASTAALRFVFDNLTGGPYAITVFHDENDNEDFDVSGDIPDEGYGTSGNPDPLEYSSFDEAAVWAGDVTIRMHYLN